MSDVRVLEGYEDRIAGLLADVKEPVYGSDHFSGLRSEMLAEAAILAEVMKARALERIADRLDEDERHRRAMIRMGGF